MSTDLQEIAAREMAKEAGLPDRWEHLVGTAPCQRRAANIALNRFVVALWDHSPLGWIGRRLGLELRADIRDRAVNDGRA